MSLDFYLERMQLTDVFGRNVTHNLIRMWHKAGVYTALYESDGLKAGMVLEDLKRGLKDMQARPARYKKLAPANGWGDYAGALDFLKSVVESCERYPDATIRISA